MCLFIYHNHCFTSPVSCLYCSFSPIRLALCLSLFHSPFVSTSLSVSLFHLPLLSSDILNQCVIDNVSFSLSTLLNSLWSFRVFYLCLLSLTTQEAITLILILKKMKSQNTFCSPQTRPACFMEHQARKA